MNQPIERIERLEKRVDELERLEKKLSFTTRDASYKSDLAQGMMRQLQENDQGIKEQQFETNQRLDAIEQKLDLILQLLQPG
jgi:tetrahydromethanopterin S-methyltransferase subunit G